MCREPTSGIYRPICEPTARIGDSLVWARGEIGPPPREGAVRNNMVSTPCHQPQCLDRRQRAASLCMNGLYLKGEVPDHPRRIVTEDQRNRAVQAFGNFAYRSGVIAMVKPPMHGCDSGISDVIAATDMDSDNLASLETAQKTKSFTGLAQRRGQFVSYDMINRFEISRRLPVAVTERDRVRQLRVLKDAIGGRVLHEPRPYDPAGDTAHDAQHRPCFVHCSG